MAARIDRLTGILDLLGETGRVSIEEVVDRFDVSPATARRDLDMLAEQQLLARTRGGAVASTVAYDLPLRFKNGRSPEQKAAIARTAVARIPRRAIIGLCGGTTSTAIADALVARADLMEPSTEPSLTVVTNAINIAMLLATRPQIRTVVTGGVVHQRSYELVGSYAEGVLGSITLDYAFIGVNAIDPKTGASSHDEREAAVNRLIASRAREAVIVADSSKIDQRAFARIGGSDLFPTIITDDRVTDDQARRLREAGYELVTAS